MSHIYTMDERTGHITHAATYSVSPKKALICYVMQYINHNGNTWEYPEHIDGIRESGTVQDHYYYDDITHDQIIAAYPA